MPVSRFAAWLQALAAQGFDGVVVFDAAVMIESGNYPNMDCLVVVVTDPETEGARLMARDGLSGAEAERRIASQMPVAEKAKLADLRARGTGRRSAPAA